MADQDAKQRYVAGSSDYLRNVSDYLHNYAGVPYQKGSPFYIEMVNSSGVGVSIKAQDGTEILGIKLMINPATMSVNMSKIVNRTQTMTAWFEDHWGEEMDTVTLQGSTAAFVVGANRLWGAGKIHQGQNLETDPVAVVSGVEPGITTRYRRLSVSYREWKKLIQLFSTNGCVFDNQGFVKDRHFIRLTYDYASFIGYFESVDTTEDSNSPYRFTYNITFRAEKTLFRFAARRNVGV